MALSSLSKMKIVSSSTPNSQNASSPIVLAILLLFRRRLQSALAVRVAIVTAIALG